MTKLKQRGTPGAFSVIDRECIGRACFQPGIYQHRGATLGGSRNTGNSTQCCLRNAYHGCPTERPFDPALAKERRAQGWRNV